MGNLGNHAWWGFNGQLAATGNMQKLQTVPWPETPRARVTASPLIAKPGIEVLGVAKPCVWGYMLARGVLP
jgi:hypothetical protein